MSDLKLKKTLLGSVRATLFLVVVCGLAGCNEESGTTVSNDSEESSGGPSDGDDEAEGGFEGELESLGQLNDTGITWCADANSFNLDCPVDGFRGQDGERGRDAQAGSGELNKIGTGIAGFDFVKLNQDGIPLARQALEWAAAGSAADGNHWTCVYDAVTGLTWEVKLPGFVHYRSGNQQFTVYNPDDNTNGGFAGEPSENDCGGVACDTHHYVQAVNNDKLCGYADWRLPTAQELQSLVHYGRDGAAIDETVFPNISAITADWTSVPKAEAPFAGQQQQYATVSFIDGATRYLALNSIGSVRAVRQD